MIKFPKTGNPSKKSFRFSFVEGNIYLTWKGKFGNQGVDLADVTSVNIGLSTDTLKKAYEVSKSQNNSNSSKTNNNSNNNSDSTTNNNVIDMYLSIISGGKSIDICLSSVEERDSWKELLDLLVLKERGILTDMDPLVTTNNTSTATSSAVTDSGDTMGNNNNTDTANKDDDGESVVDEVNDNNNSSNTIDTTTTTPASNSTKSDNNNNNTNNVDEEEHFEWLLWYSSLGEKVLPLPIRKNIYQLEIEVSKPSNVDTDKTDIHGHDTKINTKEVSFTAEVPTESIRMVNNPIVNDSI